MSKEINFGAIVFSIKYYHEKDEKQKLDLKKVKEIDPYAKTQYLDGSKTPDQLKQDDISGLDYLVYKLKINPQWIESAKKQGLLLNAWTANTTEDMD